MLKTLRFITVSLVSVFGIIYLIYVSYIYFNQEEMVFNASKLPENYHFNFQNKFEELKIPSFDGKKLDGLLFTTPKPKGLIFYLHGNAGSLDTWGNIAEIYTKLGYDFFILDYRGFGKSEGEIENENQVTQDVICVYDSLAKKYQKNQIVIVGYSIGTGLATHLAAIRKCKTLILQAPYYNFTQLTNNFAPYYPDCLKKFNFETNKYIVRVKTPIYIFHGKQDNLINFDNSVKLQKLLKPNDSLFPLENQGHLGINDNQIFQEKLKELLR